MTPPPVVLDLQGAQSIDHRDRGVARYVLEHARALQRLAPGLIERFVLNPDLPPPGDIEDLLATGRVASGDVDVSDEAVVHVMSPIELSIPYDRLLPRSRRDRRLVVTVYDLIPDVLADRYLVDPGQRRRWRTRAGLIRRANAVLAISQSAARDATTRLGLSPERVSVIGTGTSATFVPPADREKVRHEIRRRLPGLASRWVLYTGGTDERKNVERLLEAWGRLPEGTRAEWQLVIACRVNDLQRNHLLVRADQLGFASGLLVTGFVPDHELVMLNQAADLAVFPALYEGYGLPVAEALACGTPAVASNTSSLPEILPAEALFDPTDPDAIARSIDAALRDPEHRTAIAAVAGRPPATWDDVAHRTVEAYDALARRDRVPRRLASRARSNPRLAFVTPLPDLPTGVARFSYDLADELRRVGGVDVELLVDAPPHHRKAPADLDVPPGMRARPLAALDAVERLIAPYDRILYSLGNSEFHTGALAMLLRHPGAVIAHDLVLTNLWQFTQWQHPAAAPNGFHAALHEMYRGLPPDLGEHGRIDPADVDRWGTPMAKAAIEASTAYMVTSEFAAGWARIDAPGHDEKVVAIPFPIQAPVQARGPATGDRDSRQPLIVAFGLVDEAKQPDLLVDAFSLIHRSHPDVRLAFVGPCNEHLSRRLLGRAGESAPSIEITGAVDAATYGAWLQRASLAVQLRTRTNGEASAAVGDCLAAGLPVVTTAIGANRDLPADAVVLVDRSVDAPGLAATIIGLLQSPGERDAMSAAGLGYASERSFRRAAEAVLDVLFG